MLHDLLFRLKALLRGGAREQELEDELRFHWEHQIEQHRAHGLAQDEAVRRTRLQFGGLTQTKEETRGAHGIELLESGVRDLRYGARVLRSNVAFTSVAVLSLALGIGATTAIFQLVDAIRLRSLPVHAPEELAEIHITDMRGARGSVSVDDAVTYPIWEKLRERQQGFARVAVWSGETFNVSPAGEVERVNGLWVSGEFFSLLGLRPALGRLLTTADDHPGCGAPGAVISYSFWQDRFAGDRLVLSRSLTVHNYRVPIVGVTPPSFFGVEPGQAFQVALPVCSATTIRGFDVLHAGTFWWLNVLGRLKPDWTTPRASAQLGVISPALFQDSLPPNYPAVSVKSYLAMKLAAFPAPGGVSPLRGQYTDPLWMLLAITGLVLAITCLNLANLLLARASAREREIAMRLAMGASRGRLLSQLMTESLLIAAIGAGLGLALAYSLSRLTITLIATRTNPIAVDLTLDGRVFLFLGLLATGACLLSGLIPALRATGRQAGDVLKSSGRGFTYSRESLRLRRGLLVTQVALSFALLASSLLFVGSFRKLVQTPSGFQREGVFVADLRFPRIHPEAVPLATYQQRLIGSVLAIPGVISVADTDIVPVSGQSRSNQAWMEGRTAVDGKPSHLSFVSSRYFETLGIRMVAGRDFDDRDRASSPKVAVVNASFARQIAGAGDAVGRHFMIEATPSTPEIAYEIVGIVADTKYSSLREPFEAAAFLALAQDPHPSLQDQLVVRTSIAGERLLPLIRRAISGTDPEAHFELFGLQEMLSDSLTRERLMALLSAGFAVIAAVLSAAGLYGMVSYTVAQRQRELGLRLALGASAAAIRRLLFRESGSVVLLGIAVGVPLSLAVVAGARSILFGLEPADAGSWLLAAGLLTLAALFATWVPVRRATHGDPLAVLRQE